MTRKETDEELIHRSEIIYEAMSFIYKNRSLTEWFEKERFCTSVNSAIAACDTILALAREQGWIESHADRLRITPYGREWESKYWGTFR
jgi:hypothetical protein